MDTFEIGLSLPPNYIVNNLTGRAAAAVWRDAFGDAALSLPEFERAGVTSIELRAVRQDTAPELALRAAKRVWDAGLDLTIHGHLPKSVLGETFAEIYPSLVPLARALVERGQESVLTLHCYSAVDGDVDELADQTVDALRRIAAVFESEKIPLRVALEINHIGARSDPGVTYAGILEMITRADSPRIGACWDFGHAYMNVQQGVLERIPDAAFLRSVIHTHVHDLGPRTHFPLTRGVVPWHLFLDLLYTHEYSGVLNLEFSPERFQGPVRDLVYASIECLVEYGRG